MKRVIFIPGGGVKNRQPDENLRQRCELSLRIFSGSEGQFILVTGGIVYPGEILSESGISRKFILGSGILSEQILSEETSVDSVSNVVQAVERYRCLLLAPDTSVVIVSQFPHAMRLLRTFRALGKNEVSIRTCPYGSWEQAIRAYCLYEPIAWLVFGLDPLGKGFLARCLNQGRRRNYMR